MSLEELRQQLSAIEPDENMFRGIGKNDVPLLQQLLNDDEPWMAARAVYALSRISDDRATRILSQTVQDKRIEVRIALATVAAVLPAATATRILTRLLNDQNPGVRQFAIRSIPAKPTATAWESLQEIADYDPVEFVRLSAEESLKKLARSSDKNYDPSNSREQK